MNAALRGLRAENTPLVTIRLVLIDANVTRAGQVMDKAAPISMNAPLVFTVVSRIHIVLITKEVIRVPATKDGNANGLSPTVDVLGVTQPLSVLAMVSVCGMAHVIALATTAVTTAQYVDQRSAARVMEPVTLMGTVIVIMAGQDNRWTAVCVYQLSYAVVMVHAIMT